MISYLSNVLISSMVRGLQDIVESWSCGGTVRESKYRVLKELLGLDDSRYGWEQNRLSPWYMGRAEECSLGFFTKESDLSSEVGFLKMQEGPRPRVVSRVSQASC